MKQGRMIAVFAMMVTGLAPHAGAAVVINNPGFEDGTGGGADWWATSGPAVNRENWGGAHGGIWQLAINSWNEDTGIFYQDIFGAIPGADYAFSIWINKDNDFTADNVYLQLQFREDDGDPLGGWITSDVYASLNAAWQQFSINGTSPAGTGRLRVLVNVPNVTGGGAVKFDDAGILETEMGGEAVPEPATAMFLAAGFLGLYLRRRQQHAGPLA